MKSRKDVIKRASKELGIPQQTLIKVITTYEKAIKDIVIKDKEAVKLTGLVEITPVYRESKLSRNPKTNTRVMSKPRYVVKSKIIGTWFENNGVIEDEINNE